MNIAVIGLGKLGLATAACFTKACHVLAFDADKRMMKALTSWVSSHRDYDLPTKEPGVMKLLEEATMKDSSPVGVPSGVIKFHPCKSAKDAVSIANITMLIVPTPSTPSRPNFDNSYLVQAIKDIAPALKEKVERGQFHVVNIVSTVMPGSCDQLFRPMLEELTGGKCGWDFGLVYNPEFIALGSIVENFMDPDMVLIGESDKRSGKMVKDLYCALMDSLDPVDPYPKFNRMSLLNAELTKLFVNFALTMKISYANLIGLVANNVDGADASVITGAVGSDSRVGSKYLNAGLGFGGPCLPRDVRAMKMFINGLEISPYLEESFHPAAINSFVASEIFKEIEGYINQKESKATILGIGYKPGAYTNDEPPQEELMEKIELLGGLEKDKNAWFDPKIISLLPPRGCFKKYDNPYEACEGASAVIITTKDPFWLMLNWHEIAKNMAPNSIIYDVWGVLPSSVVASIGVNVKVFGRRVP